MVGLVRLGIFGGTFDPPHIGHLILAREAQEQLQLDRVLWVLTFKPPHKQGQIISSLEDRLDMLEATIADHKGFELSRIDIDRPAPHYAVDTMRLLGIENPDAELIYLMGGDSLKNLLTWYQPAEFVRGCHALGVMRRPGNPVDLANLEPQIPGITQKIQFFDSPLVDISASQIRDRIREGSPFQDFIHPEVYRIIEDRQLYRQ